MKMTFKLLFASCMMMPMVANTNAMNEQSEASKEISEQQHTVDLSHYNTTAEFFDLETMAQQKFVFGSRDNNLYYGPDGSPIATLGFETFRYKKTWLIHTANNLGYRVATILIEQNDVDRNFLKDFFGIDFSVGEDFWVGYGGIDLTPDNACKELPQERLRNFTVSEKGPMQEKLIDLKQYKTTVDICDQESKVWHTVTITSWPSTICWNGESQNLTCLESKGNKIELRFSIERYTYDAVNYLGREKDGCFIKTDDPCTAFIIRELLLFNGVSQDFMKDFFDIDLKKTAPVVFQIANGLREVYRVK